MRETMKVSELPDDYVIEYPDNDSWDYLSALCPELTECSYAYVLYQDGDISAVYGHYGNNLTPFLDNTLELLYPSPKYDKFIEDQDTITANLMFHYGNQIHNRYFIDIPCHSSYDGSRTVRLESWYKTALSKLHKRGLLKVMSLHPNSIRYELTI